jgi:hypothetical protein
MITRRQFAASTPLLAASALALSGCSPEPASDGYDAVAERTWRPGAVTNLSGETLGRGLGPLCHAGPVQPQHAVLEVRAGRQGCWACSPWPTRRAFGEIARGEFMRYFAESPWYPTTLLPSQGVRWEAVDDACANATLIDGPITLTLLFRFNDAGWISSVRAVARGAGLGKDGVMVMLPWDCALSDYRPQGGMLIPMTGEAAWVRPEGRKVYFVGHVKTLSHELLP